MPFFSIIIPVYNIAPYLRECLDSVLAQTFTDWEAICVDDGSTDGSGAILDEYAAKDKRFIVIHKKNEGVSVARNTALEVVNGRYIVFIDADDVVLRDWLKVFNEVIVKDESDVVRGSLRYWYGEQDYKHASESNYSIVARYTNQEEVCAWGVAEVLESGYSVLNCVKREIIAGVRFPVGVRIMEDCIFSAYVMMRADSASVIDYEGYLYRMRDDSAIHKHGVRQSKIRDVCDLINAARMFWRDFCLYKPSYAEMECVKKAITMFVFRHVRGTVLTCFAERKVNVVPRSDYVILARSVSALHESGAVEFQTLPFAERLSIWMLYRGTCRWGLLLLSKSRSLVCKIKGWFSRDNI